MHWSDERLSVFAMHRRSGYARGWELFKLGGECPDFLDDREGFMGWNDARARYGE